METHFENSTHELVQGAEKEREDIRDMKTAQNNAELIGGQWTRLGCQPHSKHRDSVAKTFRALLLPFLIFHLALQIVPYLDFISNNFSLIGTINQVTIFSQVQNVNIQRPYISDHLVE